MSLITAAAGLAERLPLPDAVTEWGISRLVVRTAAKLAGTFRVVDQKERLMEPDPHHWADTQ